MQEDVGLTTHIFTISSSSDRLYFTTKEVRADFRYISRMECTLLLLLLISPVAVDKPLM